jgi:hypothetical protein
MTRRLILDTKGGLCNRILAVASAQRLADLHRRDFLIGVWHRTWVMSKKLPLSREVFAQQFRTATPAELKAVNRVEKPDQKWPARYGVSAASAYHTLRILGYGPFYDRSEPTHKTPDEGWDPEHHRILAPYVQRLTPAGAVLDRLHEVCQEHQIPPHCVGVHVRRGDHRVSKRHSPDRAFIQAIQAQIDVAPHRQFFLCTDSPEVESLLRRRFPERIHTLPKRSLDRGRLEAHQDAFVDLIGLSKTDLILGSCGSSFAFTAALLGDVPLVTVR